MKNENVIHLNENKKPINFKNKVNNLNIKKLPCSFYQNDACTKGDQCTYSHDVEVIKKTVIFYLRNFASSL